MRILIISPPFTNPHGGLRIIAEWANRLTKWHEVSLFCMHRDNPRKHEWITIHNKVNVVYNPEQGEYDLCILTSPMTMPYENLAIKKKVIFMQMAEHLFRPMQDWQELCARMYLTRYPIISISKWNMAHIKELGRTGKTYYVGNGVNFKDFPLVHLSEARKEKGTVLVEGWESGNQSKDPDHIAHTVAERLKADGYRIIAYSQLPIRHGIGIPDEYHCRPDLSTMNKMYERAEIMIKATKYDARACGPCEAMTKSTPTARAIIQGDDDLIDNVNCLRSSYNADHLYHNAKKLLTNQALRERLSLNCFDYVRNECDWNVIMPKINQILISI